MSSRMRAFSLALRSRAANRACSASMAAYVCASSTGTSSSIFFSSSSSGCSYTATISPVPSASTYLWLVSLNCIFSGSVLRFIVDSILIRSLSLSFYSSMNCANLIILRCDSICVMFFFMASYLHLKSRLCLRLLTKRLANVLMKRSGLQ